MAPIDYGTTASADDSGDSSVAAIVVIVLIVIISAVLLVYYRHKIQDSWSNFTYRVRNRRSTDAEAAWTPNLANLALRSEVPPREITIKLATTPVPTPRTTSRMGGSPLKNVTTAHYQEPFAEINEHEETSI